MNGMSRFSGIFALDDIQGHKRYGGFMKSCIAHNVRTAEKDDLDDVRSVKETDSEEKKAE